MIIKDRGAPKINAAYDAVRYKDVVVLDIDLASKYCEVLATGSGTDGLDIFIQATDESLHLDETKPRDAWTKLSFPEFKGWEIACYTLSKYTLTVCFLKRQ
jgi:hypothetical protein